MRSPKVNKSKLGKISFMLPMEEVEQIDKIASFYSIPIEEYIKVALFVSVRKSEKEIAKLVKQSPKKPVAKKATVKKATPKKKAPATKKAAAKKKK